MVANTLETEVKVTQCQFVTASDGPYLDITRNGIRQQLKWRRDMTARPEYIAPLLKDIFEPSFPVDFHAFEATRQELCRYLAEMNADFEDGEGITLGELEDRAQGYYDGYLDALKNKV